MMKTKKKESENFDAIKYMREVRDKISSETEGMNFEQLKKYFAKPKTVAIK